MGTGIFWLSLCGFYWGCYCGYYLLSLWLGYLHFENGDYSSNNFIICIYNVRDVYLLNIDIKHYDYEDHVIVVLAYQFVWYPSL